MSRRYALRLAAGLAAAALLILNPGTAHADDDPGDTVTAVVTGETTTDSAPHPTDPETRRGSFTDVAIGGVFTAQDGEDRLAACAAQVVTSGGGITFETTETLAEGSGRIDQGRFSGSGVGVGADLECSVDGEISGGGFERVGTVAVATIGIHYTVTIGEETHEGRCTANVVVTATPDPTALEKAEIVGTVECNNAVPGVIDHE